MSEPQRYRAELAHAAHCTLAESPVWDAATGALWWVDIKERKLCSVSADTDNVTKRDLPMIVSAVAIRSAGGLVAATERGFGYLSPTCRSASIDLAPAGPRLPVGWRLNDGACDRLGRFWSGSMPPWPNAYRSKGGLYSLEADGSVQEHGGDYLVQNGLAFSPDGRWMYVSDSHPARPRVLRFRYDAAEGRMYDGAVIADGTDLHGRPDGAAVDSEGCYWVSAMDGGRVLRLTPDGRIVAQIVLPVPYPTNLCFGGSDLRTIYISTLRKEGQGGDIYAVSTPFQGVPETAFGPVA